MNTQLPDTVHLPMYRRRFMPCCGNPIRYYKGPEGGLSTNIMCFHCGAKWNTILFDTYILFWERID